MIPEAGPLALLFRQLLLVSLARLQCPLALRHPFPFGSLGLEEAYVPLVPYSRVPLLIALGAVQDAPVVEDGEIVVGKTMRVFATFDHRVLDGAHASKMVRVLKEYMEHPFERFDAVEALDPPAPAADV